MVNEYLTAENIVSYLTAGTFAITAFKVGVMDPLRMYKDCRRLEERWTSIKSEMENLSQK